MAFAPWKAASRCVGSARPGTRALARWCQTCGLGGRSAGIYNCRTVRGGTDTSCHAEGRALDWHFDLVDGKANPAGYRLVHRLRGRAKQLGIQAIIWDRRIWSAKSPGKAGRPYRGVNPHVDHVHIELIPAAAERLTLATLRHWLGATVEDDAPRDLRRGDRGSDVRALQRALGVEADGEYGPLTEAAVKKIQAARGWPQTGVAGAGVRKVLRERDSEKGDGS